MLAEGEMGRMPERGRRSETIKRDTAVVKNYKKAGVNRISFGLQSTISSELTCLGRIHSYDDFLVSFHQARECGFANINVDLMSAIPEQTVAGYEQTLTRVCELAPEHISSYSLILEEGTPFYEKYGECPPVSEEEDRQMYELTKERLSDFGYHRYEISNYAKAGKECDHNKKYWKRFPYLGLGLGASSCMENVRFSNERNFKTYGQKIKNGKLPVVEKEELTKEDCMAEFMYLGLRMMEGVSKKMFYQNFLVPMETYYQSSLEKCIREGLIKENGDRYCLTDFGIDVSNRVFAEFI
jgi:oxygen-independent coproporphyrinogen-3 oxidase